MPYISAKKASEILDWTPDHLRRLANAGKIDFGRTEGGQHRYNFWDITDDPPGFTETT